MRSVCRISIVFTGTFLSLVLTGAVMAETNIPDHQHSHGANEHAVSVLSMDHGEKWKTDAALRRGMQSINDAVMNAVPDYHHETLSGADADKLAKDINDQVNYMIANCKLEPDADATLHVLLGDLLSAADKVSNDPLSDQGMPHLVKTLQLYQDYFEQPGLKSIH